MSVFTVHEPPLRVTDVRPDPARFAFVRDGFSFWAFLVAALGCYGTACGWCW